MMMMIQFPHSPTKRIPRSDLFHPIRQRDCHRDTGPSELSISLAAMDTQIKKRLIFFPKNKSIMKGLKKRNGVSKCVAYICLPLG